MERKDNGILLPRRCLPVHCNNVIIMTRGCGLDENGLHSLSVGMHGPQLEELFGKDQEV